MIGIDGAVAAGLKLGLGLIDRLWPNPADAAEAKLKLLAMQQNGELAGLAAVTDLAKAQIAVNAQEAQSSSIFVAGWRPAIGWVCAAALAFQYLVRPLGATVLNAAGHGDIIIPGLDANLWELMLGLLGLGGLRTFEKLKGVAS